VAHLSKTGSSKEKTTMRKKRPNSSTSQFWMTFLTTTDRMRIRKMKMV
jgi:hypothetical protein